VATGQAVASMRGHEGRVFSVGWSPMNPKIVFSAGDDQSARMWDYTEQPDQAPPGTRGEERERGREGRREEREGGEGGKWALSDESKKSFFQPVMASLLACGIIPINLIKLLLVREDRIG
jgi:WD40 repeat protein